MGTLPIFTPQGLRSSGAELAAAFKVAGEVPEQS